MRCAFDVQLPEDTSDGDGAAPIVLSVEAGPRYSLNGAVIAPTALAATLRSVFDQRPRKVLFVRGARDARYHEVVAAFDAARGAGVHVTGIVPRVP